MLRGDAHSNDMELATMLSNLRVQAPKQLPRDDLVKEREKESLVTLEVRSQELSGAL